MRHPRRLRPALLALALAGLSRIAGADPPAAGEPARDPFPSTYRPIAGPAVLIRGATVLPATGEQLDDTDVLLVDGLVSDVGPRLAAPEGALVVDGRGKWVTPGVLDVHSHLGVYASPAVNAHDDGNEAVAPVTAQVWAEHSVWPQDPAFARALAAGVTSMLVLPGSANLIGGRGTVLKNVPSRTVQGMKFPGAPHSLKMACGENPKRTYGRARNQPPATRMGNVAGYRAAWSEAVEYRRRWDAYRAKLAKGEEAEPPARDLRLDTLAGVLAGEILVQNHCYRADEMAQMLDVAREFGYRVSAFHHAVEAYKVADLLAENGVCAAMWADWWGFKLEAWDSVRENVALVDAAGGCAIVHSDSEEGIQRLNQEAAKVLAAANRAGIPVTRGQAIRWITANPAKAMGVGERTGSLEPGKMADVVVWSGDPFSVYAKAEKVFVDGALLFDRDDPDRQPVLDFELGILPGVTEVRR